MSARLVHRFPDLCEDGKVAQRPKRGLLHADHGRVRAHGRHHGADTDDGRALVRGAELRREVAQRSAASFLRR